MALDLTALTNPYGQELAGIERNRALATALMQGGQQQPQGQMISGRYIAPSLAQNLNPLLQTAVGLYGQKKADTAETQLANTIQSKQADLLRQYREATTPQEKFAIGTNSYAPAALQAATWERLKPQKLGEGETINEYDFSKGGYIPIAQGGEKKTELIRDYNQAVSSGAFKGSIVDYDLMRRTASANRQNINVQNQLPFKEQIQKGMAEDLVKNYSTLKNAPTEIKNLDKVIDLAKSPAYLGSGAEAKLAITKFFNNNLGTSVNADKVANTEEMRSALFQSTMENLKKVDAQPSQMQQQIMQQAFGTIGTDPSAIPKIVAVYKDILTNKVMEHNARVSESETGAAKIEYPYNIKIKLPEEVKAPVAGAFPNVDVRSIDAILNSRGVK